MSHKNSFGLICLMSFPAGENIVYAVEYCVHRSTGQTASRIELVRDSTFYFSIWDDPALYRMGGNPIVNMPLCGAVTLPILRFTILTFIRTSAEPLFFKFATNVSLDATIK